MKFIILVLILLAVSCGGGSGQETRTPPVETPPMQEEIMGPETTEPEAVPEEPEFPCLTSEGLVEYFNEVYAPQGRMLRRENKPTVRLPRTSDRNRQLVIEAVNLINENLPEEHRIKISEMPLPEMTRKYEVALEYVRNQESENEIALVFTSDETFFPVESTKAGTTYYNDFSSNDPDASVFIAIHIDSGWNFDPADPEGWDIAKPKRLHTVIHELVHALGFYGSENDGHVGPENIESVMNPVNRVTTQEAEDRRIANCHRLNLFAGSSRDCSIPEGTKLALDDILYPVDKAALGVLHEVLETGDKAEDFESEIAMWLENKGCFELIEAEAPSME